MLQAQELFGITVKEFDLETQVVVVPKVSPGNTRIGRGKQFAAPEPAIGMISMQEDHFEQTLEGFAVQIGLIGLPVLFLDAEAEAGGVWLSGIDFPGVLSLTSPAGSFGPQAG